jgi:hypothetical protein
VRRFPAMCAHGLNGDYYKESQWDERNVRLASNPLGLAAAPYNRSGINRMKMDGQTANACLIEFGCKRMA